MADFRLEVFSALKDTLSFSKAAQRLFITQPSVSKHIALLEEELGVTLFDRSGGKVGLTPAGELFAAYAEEILGKYQEAKFMMGSFGAAFSGGLKIGASTTLAQYVLPAHLAGFSKIHPEISIELLNANSTGVEQMLQEKRIDVGFVEGGSGGGNFRYSAIGEDELVCVVRGGHPLAEADSLGMPKLLDYPWLLRESGSGSLAVLSSYLKDAGISIKNLKIQALLGATESIKSYLRYSDCVGFISIFSVSQELKYGQLRVLDINGFQMERTFYAVERMGVQPGTVGLFLNYLNNQKL